VNQTAVESEGGDFQERLKLGLLGLLCSAPVIAQGRALFVLLLVPIASAAHHSFAEYDRSVVRELEGELTAVEWRNPHVKFTVRVNNPAGSTEDWSLETSAVYVLERAGITSNLFSLGHHVRVAGNTSGRRPLAMNVSNLLLPSGREILFYPSSRVRWSDETAGGQWLTREVNRERQGIFRVWSVADFDAYLDVARELDIRLTPAAQATRVERAPLDPCQPQGMPGTMLTPLPIEFIDRGDQIDLQLTTFSVVRQIHLSAPSDYASIPMTDLGYSHGRWRGDSLEVHTSRIAWPYLDDNGTPQTENVEVLETFSLIDNGGRLRYTQTVRDPGSLARPMVVSWDFIDIGESQVAPITCD